MAIKKRNESFFGLHFDFHASPDKTEGMTVGARTTEEMVRQVCDLVHPDFLQVDCKGHPGYSSYPTKAGTAIAPMEGDPLKVWRKVTREQDVALYMHYSGVIDEKAVEDHPEYACVGPDGTPDKKATSTFGPYVDELLIPQMLELAGEYGVDGIWVDGECWGTQMDYSPKALALFREKTGVDLSQSPPTAPGAPYYEEYRNFCRQQFRDYVAHYVTAVHEKCPNFQIASNWAFSCHMPEPVCAPVDFLSGDYSPGNSLNSARFEGRGLAPQGKPWDLMAWNFRWDPNSAYRCPKHPRQMMQEAAAVLALGGGFQCYITQNRDGSVKMNQIRGMAEVAEFCRKRQPYCHKGSMAPQAVIVNSTTDYLLNAKGLFSNDAYDAIRGWTALLCESQQVFEIRSEHNLTGKLSQWPLVLVPELGKRMEDGFIAELLAYAEAGGSLVLSGARTIAAFARVSGGALPLVGEPAASYFSADKAMWSGLDRRYGCFAAADGEVTGWGCADEDGDGQVLPAVQVMPYGKGKIALFSMDLGGAYKIAATCTARALVKDTFAKLYRPMVEVLGSMYVDVTVLEKDGSYFVQLLNTNGGHSNAGLGNIDEIPPVGPLAVSIALPQPPRRVTLQPEGRALSGEYRDGRFHTVVDRVEIHEIIAVEP